MAHFLKLTPTKTYATQANAIKAVEKVTGPNEALFGAAKLHYIVMTHDDGRFFPVFFGERALQGMMHAHFNVIA